MPNRRLNILRAHLLRTTRWEYWPMALFYLPVALWILILGIRYRHPLLFTSANPGMPAGGLVDENKARNLLAIQRVIPDAVAKTCLLDRSRGVTTAVEAIEHLGLEYPVVLKPNSGQRGVGVQIVESPAALENYFAQYSGDKLLQEYVSGHEFGVFYMRDPDHHVGEIFSINEKTFPTLQGDGVSTLEQLIFADRQARYMAPHYLRELAGHLHDVPAEGETVELVQIGSHCRGSIFREASAHITPELIARMDSISKSIDGYYFGRYDLRVPSVEDLRKGTNIKVIEANGVSSESANIYAAGVGLFQAYRILFRQWHMAFHIGARNRALGSAPATLQEILANWSQINKE